MQTSWNDPRAWRRRLLFLRGGLVTALGMLYLVADLQAASPVPTVLALFWLALLWLPSLLFLATRNRTGRIQWLLLWAEILLDQLLFMALLHQLGGSSNPLAFYLLLPVLIAAMSLPLMASLMQTLVALAGYGLTLHWHLVPRHDTHLHALTHDMHPNHGLGMWLAFTLVALLLTLLGQLLRQAQQQTQRSHSTALTLALQRERMYQIGATLADRAHELNTPLSTLLLLSEDLASREELPADCREDLTQISALSRRIAALLRPPGSDNGALNTPQPLSALCQDLAATLKHLAPSLTVTWEGPFDPLLTDATTWQRVLANLGYNACDAGAGRLLIACTTSANGTIIQISDDGPRQQTPQSRHAGSNGMGIGLALVETSLAALGAELELDFDRRWTQARIILTAPVQQATTDKPVAPTDGEQA
ncbi:sensor histidine kinase [Alcanivorax sp. JB21]|uniref:sensor histidine kinase n=1 Tax=Alcanivorax limicola TaxID=2874102 RepID=UPI001CBC9C67|nr:sensor histidine kinase [Alcanivorax limicola]MBZ2189878.1 sensor histidine kinase [Alcanivorax limicola]